MTIIIVKPGERVEIRLASATSQPRLCVVGTEHELVQYVPFADAREAQ